MKELFDFTEWVAANYTIIGSIWVSKIGGDPVLSTERLFSIYREKEPYNQFKHF